MGPSSQILIARGDADRSEAHSPCEIEKSLWLKVQKTLLQYPLHVFIAVAVVGNYIYDIYIIPLF
jgi:hypothetical protein